MTGRYTADSALYLAAMLVLLTSTQWAQAQTPAQQPPDHPAVVIQGTTYTPRSILARNMGTPDDQTTAFPPHRIVDNIYYVEPGP